MKKLLILTLPALVLLTIWAFKPDAPVKIYPEIEAYFNSIDTKPLEAKHAYTLVNLQHSVNSSRIDYKDWNYTFYCEDNSTKSQAAQVFLHTMAYAKKFKKVKIHSAGAAKGTVDQKLIDGLAKIGYKVNKTTKNGEVAYEVKFSDKADPVTLFAKDARDKSLPISDVSSILLCDTTRGKSCFQILTPSTPFYLPLSTSSDTDDMDIMLKDIAGAMVYITKNK